MSFYSQLNNYIDNTNENSDLKVSGIRVFGVESFDHGVIVKSFRDVEEIKSLKQLGQALEEGVFNVKSLGVLKSVDAEADYDESSDSVVINVRCKEPSANYGFDGYLESNLTAGANVKFLNPLRRADNLTLGVHLGLTTSPSVDATWEFPFPRKGSLFLKATLFDQRHRLLSESWNSVAAVFHSNRFGSLGYSLNYRKFDEIPSKEVESYREPSMEVQQSIGQDILSTLHHDITLDHTWHLPMAYHSSIPYSGFLLKFHNSYAGLLGSVHYLKTMVNGKLFIPIFGGPLKLMTQSSLSYVHSLDGKRPHVADRVRTTMRGRMYDGIGPRDQVSGLELGGIFSMNHFISLNYPLAFEEYTKKLDLHVHGFVETATVINQFDGSREDFLKSFHTIVGCGLFFMFSSMKFEMNAIYPLLKNGEEFPNFAFHMTFDR